MTRNVVLSILVRKNRLVVVWDMYFWQKNSNVFIFPESLWH